MHGTRIQMFEDVKVTKKAAKLGTQRKLSLLNKVKFKLACSWHSERFSPIYVTLYALYVYFRDVGGKWNARIHLIIIIIS